MTDEQIIKALECCISAESCCECGYTKMCDGTTIHQFALDLINRQQAEIERLKKGWKADVIETENIKAEAIKEFAEILKEFMHTKFKDLDAYEFEYVTENDIDNLVKEMVGEGK